ncbi:MAG TPA: phospholipase D family protein [Candidatus Acidoferrum sp.]|jgi:putative cardiolipin synthase|nr:phospholipase D family protein [Candidatus Acidoferrum sp.]
MPWMLLVLGLLLAAHGCAPTLKAGAVHTESTAVTVTDGTWLGRQFGPLAHGHPGESGFRLIDQGGNAFVLRTALADLAERSIDAQYFIWTNDAVGTILLERLVRAADRGVRVRLLVDDIYLTGAGTAIAALDAHPNIEIRIYNPVGARNPLRLGRRLDFLFEFGRLNHRMHNKLFVADNQVAIAGGRNIADAYFGVDPKFNLRDMDVVAAGPVVQQLSRGFDTYWNSRWAIPFSTLHATPSAKTLNRVYERLQESTARHREGFPFPIDATSLPGRVAELRDHLIWAPGKAVWADPEAGPTGSRPGEPSEVGRTLGAVINATRAELVTESPYLVPGEDLNVLRSLRARGVRVRMLTNSLASTDEPPAYAVYAKDHRRMLEEGVGVYEVRPDADSRRRYATHPTARLGLHAKLAVFDHDVIYIGSFNLDPRSLFLNTEVALIVYSPELAAQMLELLERDFRPENAWRLALEANGDGRKPDVVWITGESDAEVRYHRAPEAGFWRRLGARVYALLPIRGQL